MKDVEIRHLRLLLELQATGSATAAAARLGVTPSAISHQLREMTERVKTPVCSHVGRRLVLTPAGQRLLRAAEHVVAELDRAGRDIVLLNDGQSGLLRVCAQCHTGYHWLPPVLRRFGARHPAVEVEVAVEHTRAPIEALLAGSLDLALVTDRVDDKAVRIRPLLTDEHAAIVPPDHPWTKQRFVTPEQLAAETLLLYSPSPAESFTIRHILQPAGVRPVRTRFVQLTEAIIEMVKGGLGVSVLPTWTIAPALSRREVRAVRITAAGVHREWSAATLRRVEEPAYLDDFLTIARKAISPRRYTGYRAGRARAPRRG